MALFKEKMGLKDGLVYLNHASIGPLPQSSFDILHEESKKQLMIGEKRIFYADIENLWEDLRKNVSKLVNGKSEGVAITTNTASGIHVVADCLYDKFTKRKNIVIPDIEFVTNSYCWQQVAKRYNLELRTIKIDTPDEGVWEDQIDDNTVLVALSHVQFSNGYRTDLKHLTSLAHNFGALVCVDAIQSLGALPFDVLDFDVDFVVAAGYKWMLGPLGSGILYMRPEFAEELESIMVGWFSTPNFRDLMHQTFTPWNDARRFQQSMINPVLNAFNESLSLIVNWGHENTFKQIIKLQDRLIDGLQDNHQYSISSSLVFKERSGILKINCDNDAKKLVDYLGSKDITVAYRAGGIRVSPHGYNTTDDIDRLLVELNNWEKIYHTVG